MVVSYTAFQKSLDHGPSLHSTLISEIENCILQTLRIKIVTNERTLKNKFIVTRANQQEWGLNSVVKKCAAEAELNSMLRDSKIYLNKG